MIILTSGRSPAIAGNCQIDVVGERPVFKTFSVLQPLQLFSFHVIQKHEVKNISKFQLWCLRNKQRLDLTTQRFNPPF